MTSSSNMSHNCGHYQNPPYRPVASVPFAPFHSPPSVNQVNPIYPQGVPYLVPYLNGGYLNAFQQGQRDKDAADKLEKILQSLSDNLKNAAEKGKDREKGERPKRKRSVGTQSVEDLTSEKDLDLIDGTFIGVLH